MPTSPQPILVVDDDADLREALGAVLHDEGYLVATVENGEQALTVLRAGARPCMVLLDEKMPVLDGLEFRRRQLAEPEIAKIPVVLFTGDGRNEETAKSLGIDYFLTKPVDLLRLLEVVAHFCADPDRLEFPGPVSAAG